MSGRLILLRHGESMADVRQTLVGGRDSVLTDEGVGQALHAGEHLAEDGLVPDVVHTSSLSHATQSAYDVLRALGRTEDVPVVRSQVLADRRMGALEGMTRDEALELCGPEAFTRISRSASARPRDGESLNDLWERVSPYWNDELLPQLEEGRTVLVVSHSSTLRMLLSHVTGFSVERSAAIDIPLGHAITQDTPVAMRW